jgi:hypothetical protein
MKYLVSSKEQIDRIDELLKLIPSEILTHISQARYPSSNELHVTMSHHYFNECKEITLPKSLGTVVEIESIPTGHQNELVMGIRIELKNGAKLFMLFEHLQVLMRVKFES